MVQYLKHEVTYVDRSRDGIATVFDDGKTGRYPANSLPAILPLLERIIESRAEKNWRKRGRSARDGRSEI
jgi:hypothetical protein